MHPLLFAQLDKVDPNFLHQSLILLLGALGGASAVVGILRGFRKQKEVTTEWASVKDCAVYHGNTNRRLDQHDEQIRELWDEMRKENQSIRDSMGKWFAETERALGRIEGKLNALLKE